MELGSYFLFLQEQIKDIIMIIIKKTKDKKPEDNDAKQSVHTIFISSSDEDEPMAGSSSGV